MTDPVVEAELKLRAGDDAPLDALAAAPALGPAQLGPAATVLETDLYLDTADGRLAAAGWACRLRSRGGRTWISLKGPARHGPGDPLHLRPELEGPAGDPATPRAWPASPARAQVLQLAGDEPLAERLTLRQARTERAVLLDGRRAGTLSLDRVEVLQAGAAAGRLQIVELELVEEGLSAWRVDELFAALAAIPGLAPEPMSKLELGLGLLDGPSPPAAASG